MRSGTGASDLRAEPLVRGGHPGQSAAGGLGPPAEAELHHANQGAPAEFRAVLLARRCDAESYLRYLTNSMRETFDLPGTPVRITLREKANPFAHKRKRPS